MRDAVAVGDRPEADPLEERARPRRRGPVSSRTVCSPSARAASSSVRKPIGTALSSRTAHGPRLVRRLRHRRRRARAAGAGDAEPEQPRAASSAACARTSPRRARRSAPRSRPRCSRATLDERDVGAPRGGADHGRRRRAHDRRGRRAARARRPRAASVEGGEALTGAADRAARRARPSRRGPHRPAPRADRDHGRRRQRHRQDDDDRQARLAPAARARQDASCSARPTRSAPPPSSSSTQWARARGLRDRHRPRGLGPRRGRLRGGRAAGASAGADVVIVDTAGRLHTQDHLMDELTKVRRVIGKQTRRRAARDAADRRRDDRPERPAPGPAVLARPCRSTGSC